MAGVAPGRSTRVRATEHARDTVEARACQTTTATGRWKEYGNEVLPYNGQPT